MRCTLAGLGLLMFACGGNSITVAAVDAVAGAGGSALAHSDRASDAGARGGGAADTPMAPAHAGSSSETGSGGEGSVAGGDGSAGQGGVPSIGAAGAPAAGSPGLGGAGGMEDVSGSSGMGGLAGTSGWAGAGAAGTGGAGGAACVPRKACANAGIIVDNCQVCDETHCGVYPDDCGGTIICGDEMNHGCVSSGAYCSTAHTCMPLAPNCSDYAGQKGNVCIRFPSNAVPGFTVSMYCPVAPPTVAACTWSPPPDDVGGVHTGNAPGCWLCNGAM